MNPVERFIHARVADYPWLRIPIVAAYQRAMSILPRPQIIPEMPIQHRKGAFFGFHDKCPWSADGSMLLGHAFDARLSPREAEAEPARVGLLDPDTLQFHELATTRAWNWQQGAMLQWLGPDRRLIYNDAAGEQPVARIMGVDGRALGELPLHVSSISPDGRIGLSYSFARMKGPAAEYGYWCVDDSRARNPLPGDDGIRRVDLRTGRDEVILSLADVASRFPDPTMVGSYHYFTHTLFSPSGGRFVFLHRWWGRHGVLHTRLLSADAEGQNLHQFAATHVSHVCWRSDEQVFAYCRPQGQEIGYYLLPDRTSNWEFAGASLPRCDGHPQFSMDGRYLVTDTYPDRGRMQSLIVHDTVSGKTQTLLSVRIGFEYRYGRRCDFHPRWNRDASKLCFDSAHTGVRSLCVMELDQSDVWS